ncbi:hypothetical protein [Mesorhizobium sp. M8A.F.Ca.ET.165.01.1.1]|uniref:hypothetical protein n=1 Tax=Mesorhizobium sp. M8A.F.Ca.ET.165.01.1.1 TaxID=2563960 RepID=UPI0010936345|nr:hypothetical protein [Mesorhizobium sp. M8A.F.Ca.ET.165.01.1.1]TGT46345.1 hypothetical protein EN808_03410 [Mesorhizobium sp. M8A.F.Ca.ET.165.01.1.1]
MADTIPSYTAFRIFGTFDWPPLPNTSPTMIVDGVLEIHYLEDQGNLNAVLRFLPRSSLSGAVSTEFNLTAADFAELPQLQEADAKSLAHMFKSVVEVRLRLDGKGSLAAGTGDRLLFRGARVFDQFALDPKNNFTEGGDPVPNPRWILASDYDQGDKTFFSEVVIGAVTEAKTTVATIRFNLALPTLTPQSMVNKKPVQALPFSVTYSPIITSNIDPKKPLDVATFMAGSTATGAQRDIEITTPAVIKDKWLGGMGFSRTGGASDFIYFPRGSKTNASRARYWLDDQKTYRNAVLGRLGDMAGLQGGNWTFQHRVTTDGDTSGHFTDSVSFPIDTVNPNSPTTRMVFRSSVVGMSPSAQKIGDLIVRDVTVNPGGKPHTYHFLSILNPDRPSEWITTNTDTLIVELDLSYKLASEDIWRVGEVHVGDPSVTVRLGFEDDISVSVGKTSIDSNQPGNTNLSTLFADAVRGMRLARLDLQHIEAPQPQSILSEIEVQGRGIRFALTGQVAVSFSNNGSLDLGTRSPGIGWSGAPLKLTLWPELRFLGGKNPKEPVELQAKLKATITPYSFAFPSGQQTVVVTLEYDGAAEKGMSSQFSHFRLTPPDPVMPSAKLQALTGRVGGVEFQTPTTRYLAEDPGEADYSYWRFGQRAPISDRADPGRVYRSASIDIRLRFAIDTVIPRGTDVSWGDRSGRPRPLLLSLNPGSDDGKFLLDLNETISADDDRHLTAVLFDQGAGADSAGIDRQYVVLGEEPFSILKFRSATLGNRGSQDNAQVASYDSDTRNWQFKLVQDRYHYELPSQVAGESMDKPRRLEIHDPEIADTSPLLEPVIYPPPSGSAAKLPEPPQWRAVEFRLAPSTEIWVQPSDVERGYFLPEWASYEIFRQSGAYGLGSALAALRGEFLYGLSVGVDVSRETGIARGARVAEIEALTGRPPGKPRASNPDQAITKRWDGVSRALARRPERLEIWSRDLKSSAAFAPARFEDGVTFSLRGTAVHRPAVAQGLLTEPADFANGRPRSRPHGLSGGALWPIESANLFNILLASPSSDGGSIERIALSPNGGDADQTAKFLSRQVAIISETRNGFVQRHKVEVIGRIGVLWHRAKHVVVYERTVNPTAQFTPIGGIKTRTRRPVLRKVSEYVELLQPQRAYPDFSVAKVASAGFLDSVRFNTKIINVDSAWSEDVGDYGWKIPLWNRQSARERPQVYPRPDVAFVTRAEGDGDNPLTAQECLDPDNLYFFADFKAGGDNTDIWQPRIGIDLSALPAPAHGWQAPLADDGSSRQPSALRIPRGHRRYTWRLAPPSLKTMLNAGRSAEPIFAGLDSVTFMRSVAQPSTAVTQAATATAAIPRLPVGVDVLPSWLHAKQAPKPFKDLGSALDAFLKAAASGSQTDTTTTATFLKGELEAARDRFVDTDKDFKGYLTHAKAAAAALDGVDKILPALKSRCEKLVDDYLGSLQRKQLLILDSLSTYENEAYDLIGQFPGNIENLKNAIKEGAVDAIKPALSGMGTDQLGLGNSAEAARGIVRDFESDVLSVQETLSRRLADMRRAYDDGKPWSPERVRVVLETLDAERNSVLGEVNSAVSDAQLRLSTELDDLSRRVGAVVAEVLAQISAESALGDLRKAETAIVERLDPVIDKIATLFPQPPTPSFFDGINAKLDDLAKKVAAPNDKRISDLKEPIKTIGVTVKKLGDNLLALKGKATSDSRALAGIITSSVDAVVEPIRQSSVIAAEAIDITEAISQGGAADLAKEFEAVADDFTANIEAVVSDLVSVGGIIDKAVDRTDTLIRNALRDGVVAKIEGAIKLASDTADVISSKVATFEALLSGDDLIAKIIRPFIENVVERIFTGVSDIDVPTKERLTIIVSLFAETARDGFGKYVSENIGAASAQLTQACTALGGGLENAVGQFAGLGKELQNDANAIIASIDKVLGSPKELISLASQIDKDVRLIGNQLGATYSAATGYAEKVFETAGNIGSGNLQSLPNNVLKLYAAVASVPELPNLDFARERIGYYFDKLNDVIDTTPVEAWFGRLGDELKALGINFSFQQISDRLELDNLKFLNLAGLNFNGMLRDKLPDGAMDHVKVTHAFDKKLFRAWVQIDIDLPLPERRALFNIGPFELDFVRSRFVAQVRLEASKDTDSVEQTGRATLSTDIEAVVGGQMMVSLQKVAIHYERSTGLKIDFDPKNIKLNPTFQFIQDTLGSLFPDDFGGLKVIKLNGIPVGLEHEFSVPPIDLMYGTSGVTNIQISNHFGLVAYPDFVISDRFSLSKPELPFIFSIFIIGGTGYITVDTEYRPFDNQLMVVVEAAAGGSASLGFAFGPVSGSIMITLSVALAYRKLIGSSGGGLTVSLVLLIAGNVSIAGIVTVYIGLLLRLAYRDTGQIDATGTLTVSVRISMFFTLRARANVQYKMRGGRSETTTSLSSKTEVDNADLAKAKDKADKLLKARG